MARRAKRRSSANRRGSRKGSGGASAMTWFGVGLVMGVALAVYLFHKGYLPAPPRSPDDGPNPVSRSEPELLEDTNGIAGEANETRYDFFTVLPEMEVVVPTQQLSEEAEPATQATEQATGEQYILQAGSFRSESDADQMKARLALMGSTASIQKVTVNNETWHRVRIGPVANARQADEIRRRLLDNGIDVLVLKVSS